MTLDGQLIAIHGLALAIAASVVIMGSLRANPRLLLRHFPDAVRAAQQPLSPGEKTAGSAIGLVLLLVLVGGPIWSTLDFARQRDADPVSLWTHAFLVGMIFNLVDWLVLDELWLGLGRPRWALPAGVAAADVPPFDHRRHFQAFVRGSALFAGVAGVAALMASCSAPSGPSAKAILAAEPVQHLSDYGFFKDAGSRQPAEGVIPYDLVNPLFSDDAAKHRYVYVPKGQAAAYDPSEAFDFPVGSALIKTFAFAPDMREPDKGQRLIETRVLLRQADGWVALPYIWNAEQTDAVYAPVGGRDSIDTVSQDGEALHIDYAVPNRNQCKTCHHSGNTLQPIGPKARNLNHVGPTGANQIADWTSRGILKGAPVDPPAVPVAFGDGPLDARARAYLDINCAHCHRTTGGASNSGLFLDWAENEPTGWGVHKRPTAAGRGSGLNLFVIEPGAPDKSILLHRMESVEPGVLMPELGRTIEDKRGVDLIRQWIAAMPPRPDGSADGGR